MGFAAEFKSFAMKGNVVDLAVGVIIGGAFGKIVDSVVKDLIMPLVNLVAGGEIDFSNHYLVLSGKVAAGATLAEAQKSGNVFAWGNFLTVGLNFLILAFIIFLMVKQINRIKLDQPAEAAPPPPPESAELAVLREIRDNLKK